MTKLVVLTGFPTCGKSTVSRFLEQDMGFSRLSGDDISVELFGHTYPYSGNENPERIWDTVCKRRDQLLEEGRNVVIDTTAYNEQRRTVLFDTVKETENYLIWLQVSSKSVEKRTSRREWKDDDINKWKNHVEWEDPKSNGYHLVIFHNNDPEDLKRIKSGLKKQFS